MAAAIKTAVIKTLSIFHHILVIKDGNTWT